MAIEVQSQETQPLVKVHVNGDPTSGGHDHYIAKCWNLSALRQVVPVTLDLFHTNQLSSYIELEEPSPLPLGWQKFLNLKTGEIYYTKEEDTKMSCQNLRTPKLDLKLNLSLPSINPNVESPNPSSTVSPTSPPSSCLSSELSQDEILRYSDSPEATSMVLVGCPRCLMYVMLAQEDPKCPKCKSTVLLDVTTTTTTTTTKKTRNN